ncbi:MAG: hypothetical protein EBY24_15280, partial [Betaproteobacteria bacterium]|nr:hypothetical protein [Betaproteobacteria bacterium]
LCDTRFTDELASVATHPIVDFGQGSLLENAMNSVSNVFANCQTMSSDIALIAFTSGTTGQPKGCMHQHRDVLAIADTFSNQMINPTSNDLFSGSPPLAFTFGLGALLVFPLRVGACALLLEAASPPMLLEAITKHRVTIVSTAPTAYRAMLETISSADISSLRVCVSAGEPLALDTRIRFGVAALPAWKCNILVPPPVCLRDDHPLGSMGYLVSSSTLALCVRVKENGSSENAPSFARLSLS